MPNLILTDELAYSFSQFSVFDSSASYGVMWDAIHYEQGFARVDSYTSFRTYGEDGIAYLTVFDGELQNPEDFDFVIETPFKVSSGVVSILGPNEVVEVERSIQLPTGEYKLICAQSIIKDLYQSELEAAIKLSLYFCSLKAPLRASKIVISGPLANPPSSLLETAELIL